MAVRIKITPAESRGSGDRFCPFTEVARRSTMGGQKPFITRAHTQVGHMGRDRNGARGMRCIDCKQRLTTFQAGRECFNVKILAGVETNLTDSKYACSFVYGFQQFFFKTCQL